MLLGCTSMMPRANAAAVTWTLSGVTFDDGGTASGSFSYDADLNVYSNISVITTPGSVVTETTSYGFTAGFIDGPFTFGVFITQADADSFQPPSLLLAFADPLTNAGGNDLLVTGGSSSETDLNFNNRAVVSGLVTTDGGIPVPVPEPASIALLGIGLLGLGVIRHRQPR